MRYFHDNAQATICQSKTNAFRIEKDPTQRNEGVAAGGVPCFLHEIRPQKAGQLYFRLPLEAVLRDLLKRRFPLDGINVHILKDHKTWQGSHTF